MGVSREEKLKMLSEKRLSVGNISSPMIYEFFETENEESLIRGLSVDAEIIYRRKQYKVKVNVSSKYRIISWTDGTESICVEYKNKKFAPRTNLKENWIQLNNDVAIKIESILEYNIFLILLVDADKRYDSYDIFVSRELPEKFVIEERVFSNYYFSEIFEISSIEMRKYNAMMDVVWKYEGNIKFSSIYKYNAFSFIIDNGKMYDVVSAENSIVDEQHKAFHRFEKGNNMLLAYSKVDNTVFIFTNSLQSDSYAIRCTDEKEAYKLGAWLLDRMKNMWNRDISIYLSKSRNSGKSSHSGVRSSFCANKCDLDEQMKKYSSGFYDMIRDYPSCIVDTRTLSSYLSDIFPSDKKIILVLSVLHSDGIIERIKRGNLDENFIYVNMRDISVNYGIQEDIALLGVKLWCEVKSLL